MIDIILLLAQGDMRTIGNSNAAVDILLKNPNLINKVVDALNDPDTGVKMRAADCLEKLSSIEAKFLQPYKSKLIKIAKHSSQQEVQWHLAQILERLLLSQQEKEQVLKIMLQYYKTSSSKIVIAFALQTYVTLSISDQKLIPKAVRLIEQSLGHSSPAVRARARKLIKLIK